MSQDKRSAARLLREFEVLLSDAEGGLREERGLAHDLSRKGFRVETAALLREGQILHFELLLDGPSAQGEVRVAWIQQTQISSWAGLAFTRVSWADRRRLARLADPDALDSRRALWTAVRAAIAMALLYSAGLAATSGFWWSVFYPQVPIALALVLLLWSGKRLLRW